MRRPSELAGDLRQALSADSAMWRKAMIAGIQNGPYALLRYGPPIFGIGFGAALPSMRERVRQNLRLIYGERPALIEMRDIAAVFSNYAWCMTDALVLGSRNDFAIHANMQGAEHYFECAAKGKGIILASAHAGGWEVAGASLGALRAAEVVVVMRKERDEKARAMQDDVRRKAGVKIVHIGDEPLDALPLLRYLKQKAVVAIQVDRTFAGMRTRKVRFLGRPWEIPEGPLLLSAMSGAPILTALTARRAFMDYEGQVSAPVILPRKPSEQELDQAAQSIADSVERFVRAHPTQWFHFSG